jgi:hypothetical protein
MTNYRVPRGPLYQPAGSRGVADSCREFVRYRRSPTPLECGRHSPWSAFMSQEKEEEESDNSILQPDGRLLVTFGTDDPYDPYTWSNAK